MATQLSAPSQMPEPLNYIFLAESTSTASGLQSNGTVGAPDASPSSPTVQQSPRGDGGGGGDVGGGAQMNFVWGRAWEEPLVKGVGGSPGQAPLLLSPGPVIGGHHSPSLHSRR